MLQMRGTQMALLDTNIPENLQQRLQLEGQCKITHLQFLTFNWLKTIVFTPLLIISLFGLLFLKYYKSLRVKIFYDISTQSKATHVFIKGNSKNQEEIIPITINQQKIQFFYKKLKYHIIQGKAYPVGLNLQHYLRENMNEEYTRTGLTSDQVMSYTSLYGKNEHIVDPPNYFEYLYEVMTQPFFFIQYLAAVIYILQKLGSISALLLGSSLITTSINYILLYISYKKIKEIAEVVVNIQTLRNGIFVEIPSSELVPGDLFIPKDDLYCDVILLKGQLYVNEANLTGESIPIGKYAIESMSQYKSTDNSMWIYEGSKILSVNNALAMVVHTGYASKRGRILRKILHRHPNVPHFFTTFIYFLVEAYIVSIFIYLSTLSMRINNNNLQPIIIFLNFLLIVTFSFPPSCPIYFNLIYSFSLLRLKFKDILGTEPQKTVQSSHLKIMCFDKTGTLTEDKVQVHRVIKFMYTTHVEITSEAQNGSLDYKLFGSCHTVKEFDQQLMGDQIDLKTFLHSGYKLCPSSQPSTCMEVSNKSNTNRLKVLKIYQYQSRFQSMSVLVHDCQSHKFYIFCKGAPEIIHKNSKTKFKYFDELLQTESYNGFRTIGYGYKEILPKYLSKWLHESRQSYLQDIDMLGLLVFENKLKHDSAQTISQLQQANIQSRMITGDNIYIAIQTAIRCGIISRNEEVMVIEGNQQKIPDEQIPEDIVFNVKLFQFINNKISMRQQKVSYHEYLTVYRSVVVDNSFLKLRKDLNLSPFIRVYARISPENKAMIVRRLKAEIAKERKRLTSFDKLLSNQAQKVGMVGDGANDLLAIKQADIGIGIRNCDSSYAASFSIMNLSDIGYIVRQAKCAERQIIEICRFSCITNMLCVPMLIIMETQASFYSNFQIIFDNVTKFLVFPILLGLSRPAEEQTPHKPCSNFLKRQHQLVHWSFVTISTLAYLAMYIYFKQTDQYVKSTNYATLSSGWDSVDHLVSSQYLYYSLHPIIIIFSLYEGAPWKQPIYCNKLLFIILILNLAFQIALYFIYPQLEIMNFFGVVNISMEALCNLFLIAAIATFLTIAAALFIRSMRIHQQPSQLCLKQKELEVAQTGSSSEKESRN